MYTFQRDLLQIAEKFSLDFYDFTKRLPPQSHSKHILQEIHYAAYAFAKNTLATNESLNKDQLIRHLGFAIKKGHLTQYWIKLLIIAYPSKEKSLKLFGEQLCDIIYILDVALRRLRYQQALEGTIH